jgi:hypothetical protein
MELRIAVFGIALTGTIMWIFRRRLMRDVESTSQAHLKMLSGKAWVDSQDICEELIGRPLGKVGRIVIIALWMLVLIAVIGLLNHRN